MIRGDSFITLFWMSQESFFPCRGGMPKISSHDLAAGGIGLMRRAALAGLLAILSTGVLASADETDGNGSYLPKPAGVYAERSGQGNFVRLTYFAPPRGEPFIVLALTDREQPSQGLPSLDEQGRIFDHLLGRLFEEHQDLPEAFPVFLGESRQSLIELLDKKLRDPAADWDSKRGRPRHGQFGAVLMTQLNDALQASPIAEAFAAHGYSLVLERIGRIDIGPIQVFGGGRYPRYIDTMDVHVLKRRDREK